MNTTCCECGKPFVVGDVVQVYYGGGWSHDIKVGENYHQFISNPPYCFFKRRHKDCVKQATEMSIDYEHI